MLMEPNCRKRRCKWYVGVIKPDGTEMTETNFCGAFPAGIPHEIAYGESEHDMLMKGQAKPYTYEKDLDWDSHWDNLPEDDRSLFQKINEEGTARHAALMSGRQEDDDRDAEMLWELAWELIKSDQWQRAILVGKQLVSLRPDHPASYNTLGIAWLGVDELSKAKQCIVKCIELDSTDIRNLMLLSHICARLGEYEEQLTWAKKANEADPQDPRPYLAIAEAYNSLGDKHSVENTIKKVFEIDPKNVDAHQMLAEHYRALQRHSEAVDQYWAAVQVRSDDPALWTDLGNAMCEMKEHKNALSAFRKALDLKPESTLHLNNVGYAHMAMGKFNEAIPFLTKAVHMKPNYELAHLNLTNALGESRRYEECVQASLAALGNDLEMKKGKTNFGLHVNNNLGLGYANQGQYEEAEKCFRRNLRLVASTYYNLGLTLHKQKRYEDALVYLQRAVEIEPDDAGYLCLLGYNYSCLSRFDEAERELIKSISRNKNHVQAYYDLAVMYAKMGGHEEDAFNYYRQVISIDKDHAYAHYGIACIHALQGRKDLAFKFLEDAISKGYRDMSHIEVDTDWDSLRNDESFRKMMDRYLHQDKMNSGKEDKFIQSDHYSTSKGFGDVNKEIKI